jgi:hypothetical protein
VKEYQGVNNARTFTIAALLSATLIRNRLILKKKLKGGAWKNSA